MKKELAMQINDIKRNGGTIFISLAGGILLSCNNNNNHKKSMFLSVHSALSIRGKSNEQTTTTTTKSSAQISPYMKLTQTTGPTLGEQKPKGRKNSTLKPGKRRPQT